MNLNQFTIKQASEGLRKKEFSSVELTKDCLNRIKKVDPKINAFITVTEKEALDAAEEADEKIKNGNTSPLLGIPISIKDNFCTKGIKTTAASKILQDFIPPYDATVVERLKKSGAVILGKTNLDAWAHGSSTETSDFGSTKNPWNLERLPGGSSGGATASIISDECLGAIGSETAGSIRQPASWCGIVGLKPTYGRVSRYGVIPMASSLDSPGPLTKTVEDSALILNAIAGQDNHDATSSPKKNDDYLKNLKNIIKGLKIGVSDEYFENIDREVSESVKKAISSLEKLGAQVKKIILLDPKYSVAVYTILQRAEVSSNLARYDGIRYGSSRKNFGNEAKRRIMLGTYVLSSGYFDQYYKKAQKVRTLIVNDFKKAFEKVDLIVGPTSPSTALKIGASEDKAMFGELADMLVEPSTIAGLPGVSIPCGFSKENLPVGMQIVGPQFTESLLLNAANAYEQATEWNKQKPKL
jgi:aspartyl-tRNA(Asn)/glutamyl-tRNA(Gln) amidotransferase subunit A